MEKPRIEPFTIAHAPLAQSALAQVWEEEKEASPLLPPAPLGGEAALRVLIEGCATRPGVVAYLGDRPVGYLCETGRFPWKGQSAVVCREFAHAVPGCASISDSVRARVYQYMYAELAGRWCDAGIRLHAICHFAGDTVLTRTLYHLGFGAILAENLRDLSPIQPSGRSPGSGEIRQIQDPCAIEDIAREHAGYYLQSPIFVVKDTSQVAVRGELEEYRVSGDACMTHRVGGHVDAYFVVGRCSGSGEGLLLGGTNTAQVKTAYIQPTARGTGVGRELLDRCVTWARERGFDRLFVEHETANISGSAFWQRHFRPYLFASMRYVEDTHTV